MELVQWFETTIDNADLSDDVDAVRFIFVPAEMLGEQFQSSPEAANSLDLEYIAELPSASALPTVLAAMLAGEDPRQAMEGPWPRPDLDPELVLFVEQVAFGRVIPVRTNPLDLQSLASVLTTGSGVAAGAWAGVVASGGTPLILVTVPVGMILGGAAAGIGRALEEGLYRRIRERLRRPSRWRGAPGLT